MRDLAFRGPFVHVDGNVKRGRLVREHADKENHMREAQAAEPPSRAERSGYVVRTEVAAAVRQCLRLGGKLPAWRCGQRRIVDQARKALEPENAVLRAAVASPSNVQRIAADVHVALMCALIDAADLPDTELPVNFVRGFPSVGNIPDSGVFRPVEPDVSSEEFAELYASIDSTNEEWLDSVCDHLRAQAGRAGGQNRTNLEDLVARTDKEAADGLIGEPISKAELMRKYTRGGRLRARVLPRFGVRQRGGKLRAIDDARRSRTNEMQRMHETIVTPSPEFPAHVLAELARACVELGVDLPDVELGLDDLFAAYRRVPTAHPEFMIAAVWRYDWDAPAFYEVWGHCFGLVSSVVNFNRVPHMLCAVAARLFAAPVDHFFDDYLTMDLAVARASAQLSLDCLHRAVRFGLEPAKRKLSASQQVELGVACDLRSAASERTVYLAPTPERVDAFLSDLAECKRVGRVTPREAESLFGRLGFVLTAARGSVGRAACQPLLQRAGERAGCDAWTEAMDHMLRFYAALLPSLPPLALQVGESELPPVVVYTDASFTKGGYSGLGIVVMDGERVGEAGAEAPTWLLEWLRPRGQQINHLEAFAMVCARLTFPDFMRGRRALCFVDNTVALSKAVHGYAQAPDMAAVSNALHVCDACLGVDAWFEWVPSNANVSDLPSRDPASWDAAARGVMERLRKRVAPGDARSMAMPTVAELDDPVAMLQRASRL
jgi:hypothetical protein